MGVLILSIILVLLIAYLCYRIHRIDALDTDLQKRNEELENRNYCLNETYRQLTHDVSVLQVAKTGAEHDLSSTINEYRAKEKELNQIIDDIAKRSNQSLEVYKEAVSSYADTLESKYKEIEDSHDLQMKLLQKDYDNACSAYEYMKQNLEAELASLKATREAAFAAHLKEQEVKEQSAFYCLNIKPSELEDIEVLERIKPRLNEPRILSMLIWSTYFQKPMTALCNNILGAKTITGIYKITNQKNGLCYIGQSVDVAKRWKDHAKCGLGIDTPANNKLYKAIQEYGIWNFSWELLESCSKELLNEKEIYYIDLYDSKNYGYNSSIGIKKY